VIVGAVTEIDMKRNFWRRAVAALAVIAGMSGAAAPALAQGDLLVAPTRIVLDSRRSAEVVLNNIGERAATYRITLEIKRMTPEGRLETIEVPAYTDGERAMQDMLVFSPRRVTLPPNQPQIIRLSARLPEGLADGEYRGHLLFRAIPDARTATADGNVEVASGGVAISLVPIYGVTIPVIVRRGQLSVTATIANPRLGEEEPGRPLFSVDINRQGSRSLYGEIIVSVPGQAEPVIVARGVGVYTELNQRTLNLVITPEQAALLRGQPVSIRYVEDRDAGSGLIAEITGVRM
jgi:hypothetical protein